LGERWVRPMNLNWDDELFELVASRLRSLLSDPSAPSHFREVAKITNALPVWSGLACDHWCVEAAVFAAENYPELSRMLRKRPTTAKECSACSGTGELRLQTGRVAPDRWREAIGPFRQKTGLNFRNLCGVCHGLGWTE
jgi:hypothetical protein